MRKVSRKLKTFCRVRLEMISIVVIYRGYIVLYIILLNIKIVKQSQTVYDIIELYPHVQFTPLPLLSISVYLSTQYIHLYVGTE